MFNKIKEIFNRIIQLSQSIDIYKKDTVIQSLPTLTYVNRAKKFINQNRFVEAEGLLLKALEISQKDALVYKYLGLVYEKMNSFQLAIENYQRSADLNSNDKNIWQRLGFSLLSAKEYERADRAFENANRIQPGNTDTFTGWGMTLTKMDKFSEAHEKFSQAIKINRFNFSAIFMASVMEIKLGMYDKAEGKLSFLSNVSPNEANTFEYARLKALKDDIENAIHYAQKSLKINSNMLPSYVLLGQLYAGKFDRLNSLKSFNTAAEKGMNTLEFYLEWGKALIVFEVYSEAIQKLQKALEIDAENIEAKSNLLICSVFQSDNNINIEQIKQDINDKVPENKLLNIYNGIRKYQDGDIEKSLQILRANDDSTISQFYMAKCYAIEKNDIKAREYYEAALSSNPVSIEILSDYVKYLMSQNDYIEAQRKLRKSLKHNENNITLLNLMFYVSYILVKDNFSEYNIKETLKLAEKIEGIDADLFEYPRQKQELIEILSERE